jgi:hypothetical protein
MSGICKTFATWQVHSATGRADYRDFAHVAPLQCRHVQVGQELKAPRPDDIATRFVAGEPSFVHQRYPSSASSQDESGDAACWAAAYNDDVEA